MTTLYPQETWSRANPADVGMDAYKLDEAHRWIDENMPGQPYRVVIVRRGQVVAEWNRGLAAEDSVGIASAAKSAYSNVLGILVAKGDVIVSADDPLRDYYPEFLDVPAGTGPKEGRYAYPKDWPITFRQLICNVSGYMKPGEIPGTVFNYQTFGMNILTHAMASAYGLYDSADPEGLPGFAALLKDRLADKIGARWKYDYRNFALPPEARLGIFGYYTEIQTTALDFARLGWLWANWGRWEDEQVIPEGWLRSTVRVNPFVLERCPKAQWSYGHGIWTNEQGQLWPGLLTEGFTASGAGGHYCSVFPSRELVVAQCPGPYGAPDELDIRSGCPPFLRIILDSIKD